MNVFDSINKLASYGLKTGLIQKEDLIYVKVIPKSTTTDTILDSYSNNLLAISHLKRTLTVFHIKNKEELNAVRHYNYDKSTNQ